LNLAAKFQTWQPSSNLAVATGGTSRKYTKPKKLGSKVQTWKNFAKLKLGCQVRIWHLAQTWHELGSDQISRKWYISNNC
jgi:hypothetical protein